MLDNYIFIKIDHEKSKVISSGIGYQDFILGVGDIDNCLILGGNVIEPKFSYDLFLEYMSSEQLLSSAPNSIQDLCFIDFAADQNLSDVSDVELSKILFMKHMKRPLNRFSIPSLDNKYAYLCHEDGVWNSVYMNELAKYRQVIGGKLKSVLQKHSNYPNVAEDIAEHLYTIAESGMLISFELLKYNQIQVFKADNINSLIELEIDIQKVIETEPQLIIEFNALDQIWEIK